MFGDDSDYVVEQYIRPTKVAVPLINDERADILGNFDDDDAKFNKRKIKKRKEIISASEENPFDGNDDATHENGNESDIEMNEENNDDEMPEKNHNSNEDASGLEFESEPDTQNGSERDEKSSASQIDNDNKMEVKKNTKIKEKPSQSKSKNNTLKSEKTKPTTFKKSDKKVDISDDQMKALIRGSSKQDRYVLYVTNLNYSTTREQLTDFFGVAGSVKSIRIPKVRRSAFAFVEMADPTSFKVRKKIFIRHQKKKNLNPQFKLNDVIHLINSITECSRSAQSNAGQLYDKSANIGGWQKKISK